MFLIDYLPLAKELRDDVVFRGRPAALRVTTRLEQKLSAVRSEVLAGDVVLAKLYLALDSCGLERTATQRAFHKTFVMSALPWVYTPKDFSRYRDVILAKNGAPSSEKYNQFTLISTPRRWGKTTSVGIFCAAMLFSVPNAWISVYSTGRRASKSLSDLVHNFIKVLEETSGMKKSKLKVKNTEELFYNGDISSDVRRMYSYPATVQVWTLLATRSTLACKTSFDYIS